MRALIIVGSWCGAIYFGTVLSYVLAAMITFAVLAVSSVEDIISFDWDFRDWDFSDFDWGDDE